MLGMKSLLRIRDIKPHPYWFCKKNRNLIHEFLFSLIGHKTDIGRQ